MSQIIGDLFFHPRTCEEKIEAALSIFKEENNAQGTPSSSRVFLSGYGQIELKVTVRKALAFSLVVDRVATGVPFGQASQILRSIADRTGLLKLKVVRENEVIKFVRAVVGAKLHALVDLLSESERWAYPLAFAGDLFLKCGYVFAFLGKSRMSIFLL